MDSLRWFGLSYQARLQYRSLTPNVSRSPTRKSRHTVQRPNVSGEVDYAFVPQPLVRMSISGIVEGAPEPTGLGAMPTVSYVAAVTTRTTQEDHANAFVDYLTDPQIAVTDFGYDSVLGIP
jgi:ABC-type molybdate transport system substrate-binding protein